MKLSDEKGQGLTEYLILLFLISVISIGVTKQLGSVIQNRLKTAKENISRELVIGR